VNSESTRTNHTHCHIFAWLVKENNRKEASDVEADIQRVLLLAPAVQAGPGGGAVGDQDALRGVL